MTEYDLPCFCWLDSFPWLLLSPEEDATGEQSGEPVRLEESRRFGDQRLDAPPSPRFFLPCCRFCRKPGSFPKGHLRNALTAEGRLSTGMADEYQIKE